MKDDKEREEQALRTEKALKPQDDKEREEQEETAEEIAEEILGGNSEGNSGGNSGRKYCAVAAVAGVAVGVAAVAAAPVVLAAVGFGTGGVVAGSLAAGMQASIGNVAAGSAFAVLQSWGAAGIPLFAQTIFGTAGASLGGACGVLGVKLSGRRTKSSDATKEGNEEEENQENRRQEEVTRGPDEIECQCAEHVGRNCRVTRCASCGHYVHSADAAMVTGDESTPCGKVEHQGGCRHSLPEQGN